jgi:hypothetical protein
MMESAAHRVFACTELAEMIFRGLPSRKFLMIRRVNKGWKKIIHGSPRIDEQLSSYMACKPPRNNVNPFKQRKKWDSNLGQVTWTHTIDSASELLVGPTNIGGGLSTEKHGPFRIAIELDVVSRFDGCDGTEIVYRKRFESEVVSVHDSVPALDDPLTSNIEGGRLWMEIYAYHRELQIQHDALARPSQPEISGCMRVCIARKDEMGRFFGLTIEDVG